MPTSGSGTMTPVTGGLPGAGTTAYPIPYTLLSLPRFARMIGIAPLHFAGASAPSTHPQVFPTGSACGDVWPRYDWQKSDQVSHESLAYAIKDAEETLANEVGYFAAPMWISQEKQMYPRDFYREGIYQVRDVRGFSKGLQTKYGKILSGGRRGTTLIATPTVAGGSLVYQDNDSDGLYETASITVNNVTVTELCEIKVYFTGVNAQQEWEIRPPRTATLSAGTLTMTFESWLFIDPEELSHYPTDDGFQAVDLSTITPLVTTVDVYRIYNDTSDASAVFAWENGEPGVSVPLAVGRVALRAQTRNRTDAYRCAIPKQESLSLSLRLTIHRGALLHSMFAERPIRLSYIISRETRAKNIFAVSRATPSPTNGRGA